MDDLALSLAETTIQHFTSQLELVDQAIAETIDNDVELSAKRDLLVSINGVGEALAGIVLAELPGPDILGRRDRRRCLLRSDVAPRNALRSGQERGATSDADAAQDARTAGQTADDERQRASRSSFGVRHYCRQGNRPRRRAA